jgi:hypothetical protein
MIAPLKMLPCSGVRLELYTDQVVIRRVSWLSFFVWNADRTIPTQDVQSVSLYRGSGCLSGSLCIVPRAGRGKSAYVVFSRRHLREAEAIYEALDDLVNRKDVLGVIRQMQSR